MPAAPPPPPHAAQLIAPRESLAGCIRAHLVRNTSGRATPAAGQLSHFPATASCCIAWFLQGNAQRVADEAKLPDAVVFRGPQTRPVSSRSSGPVQTFMTLLMPDALRALTGIDAGAHLNRLCAAREVFDDDWQAMLRAVQRAASDTERVHLVEDFLQPRWQAVCAARSGPWGRARHYGEWADALASRAAEGDCAGGGRSTRQVERRVRAWAGLPMRTLRGLTRAENSFLQLLQQLGTPAQRRRDVAWHWADLALQAGYADQAHLCREVRRITGFSPQRLWLGLHSDPAFWVYRAWF
jgi:AraC-like DNA-binding protein